VNTDFALKVPKIQDIIRKKTKEGWKLPDVEELPLNLVREYDCNFRN
jgi:hypothetical protein